MASTALDGAAPRTSAEASAAENETADVAIALVLGAERDARSAVAECARQAEREVQAARERVRAISARGAERSARVQRSTDRQLSAALARIAAERAALALPAGDRDLDAARLRSAVDTLADELTRGALPQPAGPSG
jgi:transcription initiation factor TFIIIB Brf1 subunit/transcription initiation factor TFIIB